MSGHVSIVSRDTPAGIHDHVDIGLASGHALRLRDPRRFGSLHWSDDPYEHCRSATNSAVSTSGGNRAAGAWP
jgi:formamidopyrimidine-DNA glycosylase